MDDKVIFLIKFKSNIFCFSISYREFSYNIYYYYICLKKFDYKYFKMQHFTTIKLLIKKYKHLYLFLHNF